MKRPPIVTVLGHVDHGKTTLLDTLRETRIAAREAGGITQGIGASQIETKEGKITFIDTPGHEAFSSMRKNGAKLADLAILVVAADDGPKPQTLEALKYLQDSSTPFIVAFTKIDLPSANLEKALGEMEKNMILFEGRGGQTPYVQVSSKEKTGLEDLLELIHLVAEVNEVSGDEKAELDATVIETNKDKRGPVVSVVVKNGTLKVGEEIYYGEEKVKIKSLFDENNKPFKEAKPGDPALIMGFSDLPEVGAKIASESFDINKVEKEDGGMNKDQFPVVIKVKSAGSLDAIRASLPQEVYIARAEVGDITDNDIFFAKTSGSVILGFETKTAKTALKLAENDNVDIYEFSIIYELIQKVEELLKSGKDEVLGKLEILAIFPYNKLNVAGGKVLEGLISLKDKVKVFRGEKEVGESRVVSIRSEKNEINQAKPGQECGLLLKPQPNFEIGDIIVSVK